MPVYQIISKASRDATNSQTPMLGYEACVDQTMSTRSGAAFSTTMTQVRGRLLYDDDPSKGSPSQTDASALTAWNPHPILLEGMNVYDLKHFVDHLAVQELYDFSLLLEKD